MIDHIMERIELKRILIVDSDERQINRVEKQVTANAVLFNRKTKIYKANTVHEADSIIKDNDIDILILDGVYRGVPLEDIPGIHFVEKLRSLDKYKTLPVIFIASVDKPREYAYKELNCLSYLPRVFDPEEFRRVLRKAFHYTTRTVGEKYIVLKRHTLIYPVKIKDIIYVEMKMRVLYVHLARKECLEIPYKTMASLHRETEDGIWVICNKSTMVNRAYIKRILMHDGIPYLSVADENICLPIGRRYIKEIKRILAVD